MLQDKAMEETFAAIKPGMRELEVAAIAEHVGHKARQRAGPVPRRVGPGRHRRRVRQPYQQNRVLREGDQFTILIENNGPGGFYTELGRTCVLGRASQEMTDEFAFVLEAQKFTSSDSNQARMQRYLRRVTTPSCAEQAPRGETAALARQGYDMVERPLVATTRP